jgi:hypothetical protein
VRSRSRRRRPAADDGADRERGRPADAREQRVDDRGDTGGREDDQADREQQDRRRLALKSTRLVCSAAA